jgi:hypothetical protein
VLLPSLAALESEYRLVHFEAVWPEIAAKPVNSQTMNAVQSDGMGRLR